MSLPERRSMTREEAIKEIKGFYDECGNDDEIELIYKNAFAMAIQSLKAWEKVKEEIDNNITVISTNDTYEDGVKVGLIRALDIIDKHLKEVENGTDR